MTLITVAEQSCNQDGICIASCPMQLLVRGESGLPEPIEEADTLCIRCGHCVAVCPTASLYHSDIDMAQCISIQKELQPAGEQVEQFLKSRRSIRVYRDKKVDRETMAQLLTTAGFAPSGHNTQNVSWTVFGDSTDLKRFSSIVVDWMHYMVEKMPQVAQALHLERTISRWQEGEDVILRNAPMVVVAHAPQDDRMAPASCTIALSYLELAALGWGLGCCWAGYFNAAASMFPAMKEALGLANGHQSFGAMMVGYPKFRYHRLPTRNSPRIDWRL